MSTGMLTRMGLGLLICIMCESLQCMFGYLVEQREFYCPAVKHIHNNITLKCLVANANVSIGNGTSGSCVQICQTPLATGSLINLPLIVLFLNGISYYFLIFMTMLEFICAQAPNSMKGLLLGIWYLTLSVKSLVINSVEGADVIQFDQVSWSAYHGAKGIGVFVSIVAFSMVSKSYRYRERNEIVSEQAIIERVFEGELLLNYAKTTQNCDRQSNNK